MSCGWTSLHKSPEKDMSKSIGLISPYFYREQFLPPIYLYQEIY